MGRSRHSALEGDIPSWVDAYSRDLYGVVDLRGVLKVRIRRTMLAADMTCLEDGGTLHLDA